MCICGYDSYDFINAFLKSTKKNPRWKQLFRQVFQELKHRLSAKQSKRILRIIQTLPNYNQTTPYVLDEIEEDNVIDNETQREGKEEGEDSDEAMLIKESINEIVWVIATDAHFFMIIQ